MFASTRLFHSVIFCIALTGSMTAQADMALKFFGTATGNELSELALELIADTGESIAGFACFELPILSLKNGKDVGFGVDCLSVFDDTGDLMGEGLQLEAKTFFFLPKGTLVNHGCTSVRPFFEGVGDSGVTHMTGSIGPAELGGENPPGPTECVNANGIVYADRGMKKFLDGSVRLSGAVNLSEVDEGIITFSCLFVLAD